MGDGPPGFPQGSTCPAVLGSPVRKLSYLWPTGLSPSLAGLSMPLRLGRQFVTSRKSCTSSTLDPTTPATQRVQAWHVAGLGCSPFARRYSGNRGCFLFLRVLRCFSSPRSPLTAYGFSGRYHDMTRGGLPHSEISGSTVGCTSPELIAAYHVLHRLLVPRHPPCALSSLAKFYSSNRRGSILRPS